MTLEENKAIVRKVTEAENNKDFAVIGELISPIYVNQSNQIKGSEGYKQYLTKLFKAFPSWHETIEDMVAEGEKVCVRLTIDTGIHRGEFDLLGIRYRLRASGQRSSLFRFGVLLMARLWRLKESMTNLTC